MWWIQQDVRRVHAKGDVLIARAHGCGWKGPHWMEVCKSYFCTIFEVGLCHEANHCHSVVVLSTQYLENAM